MSDHHFNKLTPAQAERLALLIEECGEVVQAASKVLRHGYESRDPTNDDSPTNRWTLATEIGDVLHAVSRMVIADDVSQLTIDTAEMAKGQSIRKWLHHA